MATSFQDRHEQLVPFNNWLRSIGRAPVTGWRWRKLGWIHPIRISNRLYVTAEAVALFQQRAEAGEFAKPLTSANDTNSDKHSK
jgi:hypothetical protein